MLAAARATKAAFTVEALSPNPTSPASGVPKNAALRSRARSTRRAAARLSANTPPRLAEHVARYSAIDTMTWRGICDPAGPSRRTVGPERAGNIARISPTEGADTAAIAGTAKDLPIQGFVGTWKLRAADWRVKTSSESELRHDENSQCSIRARASSAGPASRGCFPGPAATP